MRGFGFKDNGFFICTETTPRCYIIQEVSDVNQALDNINKGGDRAETNGNKNNNVTENSTSPHLPFLPWWFTAECRQQLLNVPAPSPIRASTPSACGSTNGHEMSTTPEPPGPDQLRIRLKNQLEYYFSRENLMNDRFLRSKMDADQYVPIKIIANFPKVTRLTTDYDLIVSVLKESSQVQVDEAAEKVRPASKRCTIILREIPEDANQDEVRKMFDGCPTYQSLTYAGCNSWYITFNNEEETQKAFIHLQNSTKTFNGKPVYARIKTGGAPIVTDVYQYGAEDKIVTNAGTAYKTTVGMTPGGETLITGQITIHDIVPSEPSTFNTTGSSVMGGGTNGNTGVWLGQVLAECGYIPRATFRPSVTSTSVMASAQQSNANAPTNSSGLSFTTPTVPVTMPMSVIAQQPRYLLNRSNVGFVKSSSIDMGGETDKSKENSQQKEQNPRKSANVQTTHKSNNPQNSQSGRPSRNTYGNTSGNSGNIHSSNKATTNRQSNLGQASSTNFNMATPLNKLNTHDPNRSNNTSFHTKEGGYQRNTREYRSNNNANERQTAQSGRPEQRTNVGLRPQNSRNEYTPQNSYQQSSSKSHQQRHENRGRQFNGAYNGREFHNTKHHQYESSDSERPENHEKTYDYIETDFPCLVEKTFKRQDSKQPVNGPKEEKAQFSAIVAGRRSQKPAEEKRQTYAQSLKRSIHTNGPNENAEH